MQTLRLKILYNLLKEKAIVANDFVTKNICYNIYAKKLFFYDNKRQVSTKFLYRI